MTEDIRLGYYLTRAGRLARTKDPTMKTREGIVRVVHIVDEAEARIPEEDGYSDNRISYRVVGYYLSSLSGDTWRYPSGAWIREDLSNSRDLVEYLGETL